MTSADGIGTLPSAQGRPPRNELLEAARRRLPSPAGAPRPMSRQELAEAVNAYLWITYQSHDTLDQGDIGGYERGEVRWPGRHRREAFRAVLGATSDHQLGFYIGLTPQPAVAPAAETQPDAVAPANRPAAGPAAPGQDRRAASGVGRRPRRRNDLFRRARLALPSPSGSGGPMSRAELAEAVNAYLAGRGVKAFLTYDHIANYERGDSRWPRAHYRRGLRAVLGATTDAQLGLFKNHPHPSNEEPLRPDEPGGGPVVAGGGEVGGAGLAPAADLPEAVRRVVLHWTGGKAYALRVAMRMSQREFAAKLGVDASMVIGWRPTDTGRLRYETHRMLDTMLSLATDDDLLRFDLALREIGESR